MTSRDVAADPTTPDPPAEPGSKQKRPWWQESLILVVVAVVMAMVIKAFFVQAFYIPSESMEPGLIVNDRILVQKVSFWGSGTPQRGDVVVFEDPGGWLTGEPVGPTGPLSRGLAALGLYPTGGHLVKRVIGVAGDTIVCCDADGRLEVNGEPVDEDAYIAPQSDCNGPMPNGQLHCSWSVGPVPEGEIFVMGDNRGRSADSSARLCTGSACEQGREYVPVDLVVGRVAALVWPANRFDLLGRPDSFADVPDAD